MSFESITPHGDNIVSLKSELDSQALAKVALCSDVEHLTESIDVTERATNTSKMFCSFLL